MTHVPFCAGCATGKFGENCEGVCHCMNQAQCDPATGRCGSGGCAAGWTGDTCQQGRLHTGPFYIDKLT